MCVEAYNEIKQQCNRSSSTLPHRWRQLNNQCYWMSCSLIAKQFKFGISMMKQLIRMHQSFSLAGSQAWSKDELTAQIGYLLHTFWQYQIQICLSRICTGLLQTQISAIYNCWAQSGMFQTAASYKQHFTLHRTISNQLVKANNVNKFNSDPTTHFNNPVRTFMSSSNLKYWLKY